MRQSRHRQGREVTPTAAIIDSQKRQSGLKVEARYDAGKRIDDRKRRIADEHDGHLLAAVVHSARSQDSAEARLLLPLVAARHPSVRIVYADRGDREKLLDWTTKTLGISLSIIKRTLPEGVQVLPNGGSSSELWPGWVESATQQRLQALPTLSKMLPILCSRHRPDQTHPQFLNSSQGCEIGRETTKTGSRSRPYKRAEAPLGNLLLLS